MTQKRTATLSEPRKDGKGRIQGESVSDFTISVYDSSYQSFFIGLTCSTSISLYTLHCTVCLDIPYCQGDVNVNKEKVKEQKLGKKKKCQLLYTKMVKYGTMEEKLQGNDASFARKYSNLDNTIK